MAIVVKNNYSKGTLKYISSETIFKPQQEATKAIAPYTFWQNTAIHYGITKDVFHRTKQIGNWLHLLPHTLDWHEETCAQHSVIHTAAERRQQEGPAAAG